MNRITSDKKSLRPVSVVLSAVLSLPLLVSCAGGPDRASAPPVDDTRASNPQNPSAYQVRKKGLSNTQKVAILAGAAALYYLYNQHKNAQGEGANGQYYLSRNGRVYYRDAQHRAHWVTPPSEGIQVPADEAARYREFQGYNGQASGRTLTDLPEAQQAPATQGTF